MKQNRNKRGVISRRRYMKTIIKNNGAAKDANEKVTKTIIMTKAANPKGRTLGEMVYESLNTPAYYAYMKRFAKS